MTLAIVPNPTAINALAVSDVIEAMRSIQTESDRWNLAEALAKQIPTGSAGFQEIIDQATAAGVVGNLSGTTLRLYRDTANRWPSDKRVANVSFSAHREAMVLPSIPEAAKLLRTLSNNLGAGKVTVAEVRKAIAVHQGKAPKGTSSSTTSGATGTAQGGLSADQILRDLMAGGPALIASIGAKTPGHDLDQLHAGLNKVLAHVENLRAKAAGKAKKAAAAPAKAPAAKAPAAKAPAKATAKAAGRGDLRGL